MEVVKNNFELLDSVFIDGAIKESHERAEYLTEFIIKHTEELKRKVTIQVITTLLGHEPTEDDLSKIKTCVITEDRRGNELGLFFNAVYLGVIDFEMIGYSYRCVFTPDSYNLLCK